MEISTQIYGYELESDGETVSFCLNAPASLISTGRQTDADAILVAVIHADSMLVALVAGRSILLGGGIRDYLSDYHDGIEEHTRQCIEWMVDNATDGLKDESQCLVVLRDTDDDRWRGFRGDQPMTIEEIKASGRARIH